MTEEEKATISFSAAQFAHSSAKYISFSSEEEKRRYIENVFDSMKRQLQESVSNNRRADAQPRRAALQFKF